MRARPVIDEISIRNLGVISDATLRFDPGFTALTGETGAGKTMVVTALGLLLGARADSSVLRRGGDSAVVEGQWRIDADSAVADRVRDAGGELDEAADPAGAWLTLGRSVSRDGRSRAVVGGRGGPVSLLDELGAHLVVVHGQSDQIRLRSTAAQRDALDRFAGAELAEVADQYRQAFLRWQSGQRELDALVAETERRDREAAELRLALAEIESVDPHRGEDVELAERAEKLTNLEDLRLAAAGAHELLSAQETDAPDALGLLDTARRQLERAAEHDPDLLGIAEAIAEAAFALSDISGRLASYLGSLDTDGARELELVQDRRAELTALARKYDGSLEAAIDQLERGSGRLYELDTASDRIASLGAEVTADRQAMTALAARIGDLRRASGIRLAELVTAELGALAMPNASLSVEVTDAAEYTLDGRDQVSILLRPHPGAEPRPLGRGASGGELSRVMLAIEVVLAATDPVPTFVFDEVDAGVGGASAIAIGRRLALLSRSAQVIVVTHLAQVAAFATNHLRVIKDSDGEVTASSVSRVEGDERVAELARMLSGLPDSDTGLAHARELIEMAHSVSGAAIRSPGATLPG
jgi:DNA repair protein RecN (Recombination protein N)